MPEYFSLNPKISEIWGAQSFDLAPNKTDRKGFQS